MSAGRKILIGALLALLAALAVLAVTAFLRRDSGYEAWKEAEKTEDADGEAEAYSFVIEAGSPIMYWPLMTAQAALTVS